MIVTIEVPPQHLRRIRQWASVQRTLNEAIRLLEDIEGKDAEHSETVEACIQELRDIGPAIADLHYIVRGKIWEQEKPTNENPQA